MSEIEDLEKCHSSEGPRRGKGTAQASEAERMARRIE